MVAVAVGVACRGGDGDDVVTGWWRRGDDDDVVDRRWLVMEEGQSGVPAAVM
ncbi:hypothetical protein Tco_1357155, partial [Tanacetum coccineum]